MKDRDEHLAWAKERALDYWRRGELENAVTSMVSDLNKHEELRGISEKTAILGIVCLMSGDRIGVQKWIEGFR